MKPMTRDEEITANAMGLASRLFDTIGGKIADYYAVELGNESTPEFRKFRRNVEGEMIRLISLRRMAEVDARSPGGRL